MTIYAVIVEPKRRQILDLLLERPHQVGELVDALAISQPGVSKHLRILRSADLVKVRRDAQRRWYELNPEPLREIDRWLAAYRRQWDERFDKLDAYMQQVQDKEKKGDDE